MEQPKIYFNVKVMDEFNGIKMPSIKPDEFGYYSNIPVAVLDTESRNGTYYDTKCIVDEITNPRTIFNQSLTQGNLYGEHDHPAIDSTLSRIETIDPDKKAFHIRAVHVGKEDKDGSRIIYTDIKPAGPYESILEKSLNNPYENTAFSLRSLMKEKYDPILKRPVRHIVRLVTFDYVVLQGFLKACKRFANPATEGLEINKELHLKDFFGTDGELVTGLESFNENTLMDLFEVSPKIFNNVRDGVYLKGTKSYLDNSGTKRSITHSLLNHKRF